MRLSPADHDQRGQARTVLRRYCHAHVSVRTGPPGGLLVHRSAILGLVSSLVRSAGARLTGQPRPSGRTLLIAGAVLLAATLGGYCAYVLMHLSGGTLNPVDLHVYRLGGRVVAHVRPRYNPTRASPLYDWPGTGLKFTYPPFAAMVFTIFVPASWALLPKLWLGVNVLALVATIWATLGALGYRPGLARLGSTLLLAAVLFWTEPVQRTMYLGQIELVLMALVMWDLCQPATRKWQGIGVGVAAGIKLVPLIFVPYLLLTRRYRQAAVAAAAFVATVLIGFAVLPADSRAWWLDGLMFKASRTGFTGWEGNQSLQGLITRLAGSIAAGQPIWIAVAVVVLAAGIGSAVILDRAGHRVAGILACALTGVLVSPISWDHHWVWIVPGVAALVCYAVRASGWRRWAWLAGAVLITGLFGAWPGFLWGQPADLGGFSEGLIWSPPNTNPGSFAALGDRPAYVEYHWHGFQLLVGNLYVLTGLAVLVVIACIAVRLVMARLRRAPGRGASSGGRTAGEGRSRWLISR
jgi:alpha-1,2-mannosyltransferase